MRWLKFGGPVAGVTLALAACIGGGVAPDFPSDDGGPAGSGNDAPGGSSSGGGTGSGGGSGSASNGSSSGTGSGSTSSTSSGGSAVGSGSTSGGSTGDGGGTATDAAGGADAATVRYSLSVLPILTNCQNSCHGGCGGLMISYASIVNVKSGQAATLNYVTPNDPGHSYLWCKVNPTDVDCTNARTVIVGSRMPLGGAALAATDLSSIKTWIQQGALNN
jgi:hypothetical protein